jgi:ammonium transporter, Amt family
MTSLILLFIKYVLRVPLRMSEEMLLVGDDAVHGEDAYAFGDVPQSLLYGDTTRNPNNDIEAGPGVIKGETPSSGDDDILPVSKEDAKAG